MTMNTLNSRINRTFLLEDKDTRIDMTFTLEEKGIMRRYKNGHDSPHPGVVCFSR